ncbi:hypothetical protein BD310DRAFT_988975 [Dichomitus squalens]|uniref:F-box domain-containing protein n=1 Tax=Dichomitus squalens TaxID=114155 RepID=A0A4V2K939_9APHY|nr:hypothetical protein BD310DRAFT_988975 [Dichomitus squalens]
MDVGGPPLDCKITRLPVEVCEHIMDMLSSSRPFVEDTRALRCCALVCRAWRVRSQRNLFYSVVLRDLTALQRFSAVLDNGPPPSPLSLFPIAFQGRLPLLKQLTINHVREDEEWYQRTSEWDAVKPLKHLPLHTRISLFFSGFVTMVNALPSLQLLECDYVLCMTLGHRPLDLEPQADGMHIRPPPFAPKPHDLRLGIDLGLCSALERLDIWLGPESATDSDGQSLDMLKATLISWKPDVPLPIVHLHAYHEYHFTRQEFADLLGTVGRVVDELVDESRAGPSAAGEVGEQGGRWRIWAGIYDSKNCRDWWWTHIQKCFPTLARSAELDMSYDRPLYKGNKWKDNGVLPPVPTTTA